MDILDENFESIERRDRSRPVFLTVLCILTWVGSGLAIFSTLFQIWAYAAMYNSMNTLLQNQTDTFGFMFWNAIATIAGSVICVFGALLMFKLKKGGFFIYLVGQIIPMAAGIYSGLIMTSGMGIGGNTSFLIIIATMIFPVAFIIMYGVNLKYMNK